MQRANLFGTVSASRYFSFKATASIETSFVNARSESEFAALFEPGPEAIVYPLWLAESPDRPTCRALVIHDFAGRLRTVFRPGRWRCSPQRAGRYRRIATLRVLVIFLPRGELPWFTNTCTSRTRWKQSSNRHHPGVVIAVTELEQLPTGVCISTRDLFASSHVLTLPE
jgi:hypothetical protein